MLLKFEELPIVEAIRIKTEQEILEMTGVNVEVVFIIDKSSHKVSKGVRLQELICTKFGVSWAQVVSAKNYHKGPIYDARIAYAYVCKVKSIMSLSAVSVECNRNHSSMTNRHRSVKRRMNKDEDFASIIQLLLNDI